MFTILTKQNLIYKADEVYGTHFMTFAIAVSFTKLMSVLYFMSFAIPVSFTKLMKCIVHTL